MNAKQLSKAMRKACGVISHEDRIRACVEVAIEYANAEVPVTEIEEKE